MLKRNRNDLNFVWHIKRKSSQFVRGLFLFCKNLLICIQCMQARKVSRTLKRHYKEKGVVPRTHELKGTRPHNAYPFEVRNRLLFIISYHRLEMG